MTALILLFALAVWILLTLAATRWGSKWMRAALPQKKWAGVVGAFTGFMLLMGGWWLYWGVEYLQVRANAEEMCKQAGVKVYITPEEWKKRNELGDNFKPNQNAKYILNDNGNILFQNREYAFSYDLSSKVAMYSFQGKKKNYTTVLYRIYYDKEDKVILATTESITTKYGYGSGLSFKPWIDSISQCNNYYYEVIEKYSPPQILFK